MSRREITLTLNGRSISANSEPRTHLADLLREDLLLTGTHLGCEQGVCGACTLFVDGKPIRSCITLATACEAADIRTIEGFEDDPLMERLRDAFKRHHGLQCGFCTPGMLATAYDIVRRLPNADEKRIRRELSGNLCRCTGYQGIVAAISDVLANDPPAAKIWPQTRNRPSQTASAATPRQRVEPPASAQMPEIALPIPEPEDLAGGVTLSREVIIPAPVAEVWPLLRHVPSVAACIPGASVDEPIVGDIATGRVVVSMGPIRAKFAGSARTRFEDTTHTGQVIGSGRDGLSRSVLQGAMDFSLNERDEATSCLKVSLVYRLKGPLAQLGRPALVKEIADRLLKDTAGAIAAKAHGIDAPSGNGKSLNGFVLMISVLKGMFLRLLGIGRNGTAG